MEHTAELVLLLLLALPATQAALDPGIRRRFRAFPPMQAILPVALVVYASGVIAVYFLAPYLLRWAGLLALVIVAFELWQRRDSFGIDRGLPPGSLSLVPTDAWKNPDYYMNQSKAHGPVFKFRHLTRPAVGIVGLDRIGDFLRQHGDDVLVPAAPFDQIVPGGFVRYMSGRHHADTAATLRSAFAADVIAGCDHAFAVECRIALESIQADATSVLPAIDTMVFNQVMMCFVGLGSGELRDRFQSLFEQADYRRLAEIGREQALVAIGSIINEMRTLTEASAAPQQSFLSELVARHPDAVRSDEILGNFAYALHTGRIDAAGLLTWMIAVMGENPQWAQALRLTVEEEGKAALRTGGLADRIVRETLRLRQSEFLMRRTKVRFEWGGFVFPRGWQVRLCIAESHRLPDAFENPERFDPDRFLLVPGRARYAPFGFAPHLCPGEHLTRALGRHLASELVRSYDLEVTGVTPWEFSGFHWRPNPLMSVKLCPRGKQ